MHLTVEISEPNVFYETGPISETPTYKTRRALAIIWNVTALSLTKNALICMEMRVFDATIAWWLYVFFLFLPKRQNYFFPLGD